MKWACALSAKTCTHSASVRLQCSALRIRTVCACCLQLRGGSGEAFRLLTIVNGCR